MENYLRYYFHKVVTYYKTTNNGYFNTNLFCYSLALISNGSIAQIVCSQSTKLITCINLIYIYYDRLYIYYLPLCIYARSIYLRPLYISTLRSVYLHSALYPYVPRLVRGISHLSINIANKPQYRISGSL